MSDWKQIGTVTRAWRDGDRVMAEVALDDGGALSAVISTRDVGIAGYALDDDGLDQIAAKVGRNAVHDASVRCQGRAAPRRLGGGGVSHIVLNRDTRGRHVRSRVDGRRAGAEAVSTILHDRSGL